MRKVRSRLARSTCCEGWSVPRLAAWVSRSAAGAFGQFLSIGVRRTRTPRPSRGLGSRSTSPAFRETVEPDGDASRGEEEGLGQL